MIEGFNATLRSNGQLGSMTVTWDGDAEARLTWLGE